MLKHLNGTLTPEIKEIGAAIYDSTTSQSGNTSPPRITLLIEFSTPMERHKWNYAHGEPTSRDNIFEVRFLKSLNGYSKKGRYGAPHLLDYGIKSNPTSPNLALVQWSVLQTYVGVSGLRCNAYHSDFLIHKVTRTIDELILEVEIVPHQLQPVRRNYGGSSSQALVTSTTQTAPLSLDSAVLTDTDASTAIDNIFSIDRSLPAQTQMDLVTLCNSLDQAFVFV